MAHYTVLSAENIRTIMMDYDLGRVHSYDVLSGGSENTNYKLVMEACKVVLTVCEQKTFQGSTELASLLEHLAHHNFSTSKIVRNSRMESIGIWKGKPIIVKNFIEGQIIEELSNDLLELLGRELGKLHQIPVPEYLPERISYGKENFYKVEEYAAGSSFQKWLYKICDYVENHISAALPKALIHSDLFYDNVIVDVDGHHMTIVDFEEASYYYRVFDIGMTIIGVCSGEEKLILKKAIHLLRGYSKEIQLIPRERDSLKAFIVYAAAAMSFWRHRNFNQTNPTSERADHYLALKNLADHVMGISDERFSSLF